MARAVLATSYGLIIRPGIADANRGSIEKDEVALGA